MMTTLAPLALALLFPAQGAQETAEDAASAFASLKQKYEDARAACFAALEEAGEDEDKQREIFETMYPRWQDYAPEAIRIADASPSSDTAFEALSWVIEAFDDPGAQEPAFERLDRRFGDDPRMKDLCARLVYASSPAALDFLEKRLKSPHREVQGVACYVLARALARYAEGARTVLNNPDLLERVRDTAGEDAVEAMKEMMKDPDALEKRAVELLTRATSEFADVSWRRGTIGKAAERDLFEVQNLSVGKVAPEIEGEDIDGVPFKLSDYRGKIVFLDFWGDW